MILAAYRPCDKNGSHRGGPIYRSTYAVNESGRDRIERRAVTCASHQLVLVMLVVGSSLLLMRKLSINGAGLIWFERRGNHGQELVGYM